MQNNHHPNIEFILIPAGDFLYGEEKESKYLPEYEIAKYPVTVAQYRVYCQANNKDMPPPPSWGLIDDHPIVNIRLIDAKAFCEYYGYRLPTEEEWEKAARGTDGREYPWGNEWEDNKCVNSDNSPNSTQPVGTYPQGASPYGCLDMAGNVWEWTDSWYDDYQQFCVQRGGSFSTIQSMNDIFRSVFRLRGFQNPNFNKCIYFRCAYREFNPPNGHVSLYGFRVAR